MLSKRGTLLVAQKAKGRYLIHKLSGGLFRKLKEAGRELLPIILVIAVFQIAMLPQPFPQRLEVVTGALLVIVGLMLFVQGLEPVLFPIGEILIIHLSYFYLMSSS